MRSPILDIEHKSFFRNSETPIEEVPLLSPCAPTPTTMLFQNSGYNATRDTKLLPHYNGDPKSRPQNLKPNSQISCYKTFDTRTTKLLPDLNAEPRSNT